MEQAQIRSRIKEIVAQVAGIPAETIADDAHLVEDLDLDSLALLEIGVDVDYAFQLALPEERMQEIASVDAATRLVAAELAARNGAS